MCVTGMQNKAAHLRIIYQILMLLTKKIIICNLHLFLISARQSRASRMSLPLQVCFLEYTQNRLLWPHKFPVRVSLTFLQWCQCSATKRSEACVLNLTEAGKWSQHSNLSGSLPNMVTGISVSHTQLLSLRKRHTNCEFYLTNYVYDHWEKV